MRTLMSKGTNIIISPSANEAVQKHIINEWSSILPFEVHPQFAFQIRLSKEEYDCIDPSAIKTLQLFADTKREHYKGGDPRWKEWEKRYAEDFYWGGAGCYIFNYVAKLGYCLETKCEYGYEGIEKSETIFFFTESEFPPLILFNAGKHDKRETRGDDFIAPIIPKCLAGISMCPKGCKEEEGYPCIHIPSEKLKVNDMDLSESLK